MRIKAFSGLIPAADKVESVAAVPYDVVNREEAAILAKGNPESLLNLSRAEIGFSPITDPYSEEVYQRAKIINPLYKNRTYADFISDFGLLLFGSEDSEEAASYFGSECVVEISAILTR